jgi:flavin-dependent dehydrogenase
MKNFDVVIIGAGLAGLQCARLLSEQGAKILLVDRKTDLTKGVHTTGIFVRKTFVDFDFPRETLGPPVRHVSLYSPGLRKLDLISNHDEFRVGKMGVLYESYLQECIANGVQFAGGTLYKGINHREHGETQSNGVGSTCVSGCAKVENHNYEGHEGGNCRGDTRGRQSRVTETIVTLETAKKEWKVMTKILVGSDGAQSRVARDLGLDQNEEFIVGVEEIYKGAPFDEEPRLHCFLDAKLAPGYLAWITNDGDDVHIGVGGYADKFDPRAALEEFKSKVIGRVVKLDGAYLDEKRGGKIPVGGVLKNIANEMGLLVGDAAGAVSPLTAGGLDPCMRMSRFAAEVIWAALRKNDSRILNSYSGEAFRVRFISRLWMRESLKRMSNQSILELGCAILSLPILRKLAAHVFFGRGSFPDARLELGDDSNKIVLAKA